MTELVHPELQRIIDAAKKRGMEDIYTASSPHYDAERQVHNLRLEKYPATIVRCRCGHEDIGFWLYELNKAKEDGTLDVPVSIRSGGHHHEGMCSNDGGVVLMLSEKHDITVEADGEHVRLGPAQRLGKVIDELADARRMMPTGGCGNVCVGGLTHGGGWGLSYRNEGLTVDALCDVEMVLPNGKYVKFNRTEFLDDTDPELDVEAKELFWAITGGGGGNFGAVTRFRFKLYDPGPKYTTFTLLYSKAKRMDGALAWTKLCNDGDTKLNLVARMATYKGEGDTKDSPAFTITGVYYGEEDACLSAIEPLLAAGPFAYGTEPHDFGPKTSFRRAAFLTGGDGPRDSVTGEPFPYQAYALQLGAPSAGGPETTCKDPEPHKVSSAMPHDKFDCKADKKIITAAANFIDTNGDMDDTNLYLSFHGMGGRGGSNDAGATSFPWRNKDYMLQIQAWWQAGSERANKTWILKWVAGLSKALTEEGGCAGAFIAFPDEAQPVSAYYDTALEDLCDIKSRVDLNHLLKFDMGLPPG